MNRKKFTTTLREESIYVLGTYDRYECKSGGDLIDRALDLYVSTYRKEKQEPKTFADRLRSMVSALVDEKLQKLGVIKKEEGDAF